MNVKPFIRIGLEFIKHNATKILAATAVVSEGFALWMTHKRAPEAQKRLQALPPTANWWDKFKTVTPVYLPIYILFGMSSASIIGGCVLGEVKAATWANLAMASSTQLQALEQKVIDEVGEEKYAEMQKNAAKELQTKKPPESAEIIATTNGADIFFDPLSGRYFTSSIDYIKQAAAELNNGMLNGFEMWATVNRWYDRLDIPTVKLGDYAGWNPDHMLKVEFGDGHMVNGKSCRVICYWHEPIYKRN